MSNSVGPSPWQNHPYLLQHQRPSLLETAAMFARSNRQHMVCVVLHLKRESASVPWGIAFSKFDDRVVLGKVQDNGRHIVEWVHNIDIHDHPLDWRVVFSPFEPLHEYSNRLKDHVSSMPMLDARHQQLWPGDLLLGIDGFDPRYFQSLAAFTNYLRAATCTTFVVLRHPRAATATLDYQDQRRSDQPYLAALSADVVWRGLFPSEGWNPNTTFIAHDRNALHQVTPDRSVAGVAPERSVARASNVEAVYDPRLLFRSRTTQTSNVNPLDLLSRVAGASSASVHSFEAARDASTAFLKKQSATKKNSACLSKKVMTKFDIPSSWRNPWFIDATTGLNLPFDDNLEFSPEDGQRAEQFLKPIHDFPAWLMTRKNGWRQSYKVYKFDSEEAQDDSMEIEEGTVGKDFWNPQGFTSFDDWLTSSVKKWKLSYSWNKKTTRRIQEECEAVVHVSQQPRQFQLWLRIRRNQWRLLRRKRQRQRNGNCLSNGTSDYSAHLEAGVETSQGGNHEGLEVQCQLSRKRRKIQAPTLTDIAVIDVILEQEDQERKRRQLEKRRLVDIRFLFDASLGAPDDIVVLCFSFLDRREYNTLLCINKGYANALKAREEVWRQLCPSHWILPRRPRKPWHELYFHRLRIEQRDSRKLWDDLLLKCSTVLFKGDHLQKIEKLIQKGEDDFGFDVNYVSPVVCERNSILNLAVIHQRHKVVRWLVDQKRADIESYDRGHFTALLNAAWAGDRQLVRFLLQRGADRTKIGYGHYSKALAHPDFKGLTAEGWATRRGHSDIAKLIHLGL